MKEKETPPKSTWAIKKRTIKSRKLKIKLN
jgi:hypothetical protein